jgi:DNA-binding Lrp family transcriptional regulator
MSEELAERIDDTDLRILELLQKDGRMSVSAISKEVGKGISTVHARIGSLRKRGIIDQFTAVLNPAKLGRPTLALILITIRYRVPGSRKVISQREFCGEIAQHPFVQEVHVLSGEFDVLLKVRAKDVQEMNNFIVDSLREMPAVERTLTMFAMDTYLDTLMLRKL